MSFSENNNKNNIIGSGALTNVIKEGYEAKVGYESLNRVGRNKQLKGTIHEVMFKDKINSDVSNIVSGKRAYLSQHTNAIRDDIIVKQGNKIVNRYQLKDTISKSGINDTAKRVASHQYKGTNLVGTKETKELFTDKLSRKGNNITQQMSSTDISSYDTQRIADKALGNSHSYKNTLNSNTLKTSGKTGAISAGMQAALSASDLINDRISAEEYTANVIKEGVKGTASQLAINTVGTQVASKVTQTLVSKSASKVVTTLGASAVSLVPGAVVGTLIEAGVRTASDNGKDFVENTIDVVFEPLEAIGSFIDNIFGW